MGDYRKLQVWEEAKELAIYIYKLTKEGEISKDYGLRDQIRRSAVSIASNIAEGEESGRSRKAINYFYISKGSLAELETQLDVAKGVDYLNTTQYDELMCRTDKISRKLRQLIKFRETSID